MKRTLYDSDHEAFRESFRKFVEDEIAPHDEQWNRDSIVPREVFAKAGKNGFLGMDVPEGMDVVTGDDVPTASDVPATTDAPTGTSRSDSTTECSPKKL